MDWLMIAGVCLSITGLAFLIWQNTQIARHVARHKVGAAAARRLYAMGLEWSGVALWFGVVLAMTAQILQQLQRGAPLESVKFSILAGACAVFACGLFVGRLHLRRQLRLEAAAGKQAGETLGLVKEDAVPGHS